MNEQIKNAETAANAAYRKIERSDIRNAVDVILAVADAIRDLGSIPSSHLYAMVMGKMSLEQYNSIIGTLKNSNLVKEENHLLTWVGPRKEGV